MHAWITVQQWLALIYSVLAAASDLDHPRPDINIASSRPTSSVSSTSSSNYGGLSATATAISTVNVSLTSVASSPSTQAQLNIPIIPASFSPFPVPSDNPILSNYPIVHPSQPLSVSYIRLSFLTSAETNTFESYFIGRFLWTSRFRTCVGSRTR